MHWALHSLQNDGCPSEKITRCDLTNQDFEGVAAMRTTWQFWNGPSSQCLRRTTFIFFRSQSEQEVPVPCFSFSKHHILKDISRKSIAITRRMSRFLYISRTRLHGTVNSQRTRGLRSASASSPCPGGQARELSEIGAARADLAGATFNNPVDIDYDPGAPSRLPPGASRLFSSVNIKTAQFETANASIILGAKAWSRSLACAGGVIILSSSPSKAAPGSQDLPDTMIVSHHLPEATRRSQEFSKAMCGSPRSTTNMRLCLAFGRLIA